MTITLTGATGFLGRRVLKRLRLDGHAVRCAVRPSSNVESLRQFIGEKLWTGVSVCEANLSSEADCKDLLDGSQVVIHAAAALGGCTSSLFLNTNVPTRTLMTTAANIELIERFVLVSSLGVYDPQRMPSRSVFDETFPIDEKPHLRDAYTYSKVIQEQIAWGISNDLQLPVVVVRPGVIFGDERGVLSHRVGLPIGGWLLRMGSQQLPFTYVENCADAIVEACFADGVEGQAINIVDDNLLTGKQLIRRCKKHGSRIRAIPIPRFAIPWLARFNEWYSRRTENQIPAVLTRHRVGAMWKSFKYSNQKAKELLGWTPAVDMETAIARSATAG